MLRSFLLVALMLVAHVANAAVIGEAVIGYHIPTAASYQFRAYTAAGAGAIGTNLGEVGSSVSIPWDFSDGSDVLTQNLLDGNLDRLVFQLNNGANPPAHAIPMLESYFWNDTNPSDAIAATSSYVGNGIDFENASLSHYTIDVVSKSIAAGMVDYGVRFRIHDVAALVGVPEPSTVALSGLLLPLIGYRWRVHGDIA